jgi:hypothetical protein
VQAAFRPATADLKVRTREGMAVIAVPR